MNKAFLITLMVLLFSSIVFAEENTDELDVIEDIELEEAEQDVVPAEELEDEEDELGPKAVGIKPYIRTLFFSGTGIASNPTEALDFYTVKVVGGKVATSSGEIFGRGILYLDKEKYRLIKLVVEGDTAKAVIAKYTPNVISAEEESSLVEVGTLSLTKVAKPNVDVWAGIMELNDKKYNFYLITHKRVFKPTEVAEKTRNYCREHPYDETCKSVAGYLCKDDSKECRLKVYNYCENRPTDSRCKEILRSYCAGNMRDARCREEVKDYCEEFPSNQYCKSEIVDFCKENPGNEKCHSVFTEYCKDHPRDARCAKTKLEFCKENPTSEECKPIVKQFCEYNQTSELCGGVILDYCKANPDTLKCRATATTLCILPEYRDTEKCQEIITQSKERVRQAIADKAIIGTVR